MMATNPDAALQIEHVATDMLAPAAYNPRQMTSEARTRLERSVREFGMVDPIIARRSDRLVIGGHQRLAAALALGLATVPVVYLDNLDDHRAAALNVALNNPAEQGAWDMPRLTSLLSTLDAEGFDATLTGFSETELRDLLTIDPPGDGEDGADAAPSAEPKSVVGEVYELGAHRLMCGDALRADHVDTLLGGRVPEMAYCDPPYGISIVKKAARTVGSGGRFRGTVGTGKIIPANTYDEVIGDESTDTAAESYRLCAGLGIPVLIFWGANHYSHALPASSCWVVWDKRADGPSNDFADAELAWTNQKSAVRVFRHLWNGMLKASEKGERRVHPTQKPVALAEWCFEKYGKPGDAVLDLFGGSGSTLIAAERAGRSAYLMELSPGYCDVIRTRYAKATGCQELAP